MRIKITKRIFFFSLLLILSISAPINSGGAQNNDKLDEMLTKLAATNENTDAEQEQLRSVIEYALTLLSSPEAPEEARRRLARGEAAVNMASDNEGLIKAVKEFKAATRAAPWLAETHYNLGVVQDKVGRYDGAIKSLQMYLFAAPNATDQTAVQFLIYQIEFKKEEAEKGPAVTAMDKTMYTTGSANIRSGPGASNNVITELSGREPVQITGKAAGVNWYQIALADGRTGYVFGNLLAETLPAVTAVHTSSSDSDEAIAKSLEGLWQLKQKGFGSRFRIDVDGTGFEIVTIAYCPEYDCSTGWEASYTIGQVGEVKNGTIKIFQILRQAWKSGELDRRTLKPLGCYIPSGKYPASASLSQDHKTLDIKVSIDDTKSICSPLLLYTILEKQL